MENPEHEVIVIGAGVHGSSAALQLAKRGKNTLLIDQFSLPHTRGSSTGASRIFRSANFGNPALNPLVKDSLERWQHLERDTKTTLFRPWPMLVAGGQDNEDIMMKMKNSIKGEGTSRWVTAEEIEEEYGFRYAKNGLYFMDTTAGVLSADKCVNALQSEFVRYGGSIRDMFPVSDIRVLSGDKVEIIGPSGSLKSKNVVICGGPWSTPLLHSLSINVPLRPIRVPVLYWKLRNPQQSTVSFVDTNYPEGHFYGTPSLEYPGLVKINFHGGLPVDPTCRDLTNMISINEQVKEFVRKHCPFVHPDPVIVESCMYTMTPDEEFILDTHPHHKNVIYACGFSGTGFKIAPTVGEIIARMVSKEDVGFDIRSFQNERFFRSKI